MMVLKELEKYTRLTENRSELNKEIASHFNIAEQKLILDSVQKMLTIEFFHVLSLMRAEKKIKENIRGGM